MAFAHRETQRYGWRTTSRRTDPPQSSGEYGSMGLSSRCYAGFPQAPLRMRSETVLDRTVLDKTVGLKRISQARQISQKYSPSLLWPLRFIRPRTAGRGPVPQGPFFPRAEGRDGFLAGPGAFLPFNLERVYAIAV